MREEARVWGEDWACEVAKDWEEMSAWRAREGPRETKGADAEIDEGRTKCTAAGGWSLSIRAMSCTCRCMAGSGRVM